MSKHILVTGGAGFIGSHLVEMLLDQGHHVTVLDNLSTGKLGNLPEHDRLDVVIGDVADVDVLSRCVFDKDAIVHLAAVASVQRSVEDPLGTNRTNMTGTLTLLEAARAAEVKRFIYASSAAVYGDATELPVRESAPLHPLTPYAIDKLAGEQYLEHYHRQGTISGFSFRFFNVFGPRQDASSPYSGVISVFADRVRAGRPVTIYGDGEQTRDFIFVRDVAAVLASALEWPREPQLPIVNVGQGRQLSLLAVLGAIENAAQKTIERRFAEAREGDIRHSRADITRLRERMDPPLAFTPLVESLKALVRQPAPDAEKKDRERVAAAVGRKPTFDRAIRPSPRAVAYAPARVLAPLSPSAVPRIATPPVLDPEQRIAPGIRLERVSDEDGVLQLARGRR